MSELLSPLSFGWRSAMMGSILLPIVVGSLLLLLRARDRHAACWLAALMGSTVSSSIPFFIGFAGAYDAWPGLTFLPVDTTLSFAPLLYLYVYVSLTGGKLGWRKWLLLPALTHITYQFGAFTLLGDYRNKWAFTEAVHSPYIEPVVRVSALALTALCFFAVHRLYSAYRRWLPTARADDDQYQPLWLNYFMVLCGTLGILWIGVSLMELLDSYNYRGRFWLVIIALFTVLMILLETLSRAHLAFPRMPVNNFDQVVLPEPPQDASADDWSALGQSLHDLMVEQQWFLEPDFSLTTLAQRAGQNRSYISRALNEGLGQNFSQFVNAQRVKHASELLTESDRPLLDIAFDSGFGSKASFNRVFRSLAGCTPSQFRTENGSNRKNR